MPEVSPNGRKLWRFCYRLQPKANMLVRGVYPQVSLKQARLARMRHI
ncbi:Arm DNA-binding domain-containing protein [Nitratidesulfovibrio vulgaris]|nr:Arm DNA-binding domain-containing protein [Nitratidesulfovibrio vulgaris]